MPEPKLLDKVTEVARLRHLRLRTEQAYRTWIKRYIFFHQKRHPQDLGAVLNKGRGVRSPLDQRWVMDDRGVEQH